MRTAVPEKILKIIEDIDARGNVPLTRLTVMKKWFEHPGRMTAFGLWVARRAAGRKGRTQGEAGKLLEEARAFLGPTSTRESLLQGGDRKAAESLHDRARAFHSDFEKQKWGPVRIIHCWQILLVEQGLAVHLGITDKPTQGYKLAVDWAGNYDPQFGNGLNGPSRGKLEELVRFMFTVEAVEDGG